MDSAAWLAAGVLALIGVAHSVLGEREILGPLFAQRSWSIGFPRRPSEVLLRGAWHFTTAAWLGLAAIVCGASPGVTVAVVCLGSGLVFLVWLRGHLAWPLFAIAGFAALHHEGLLPSWLLGASSAFAIVVALVAAALHGYWAAGGRWGLSAAVPRGEGGGPLFEPGPLACLAVVVALLVFATVVGWVWLGEAPLAAKGVLGLGAAVLTVRAIGDGKRVGFTKTQRSGEFAHLDDRLYTPLVVALLFGALAVLMG